MNRINSYRSAISDNVGQMQTVSLVIVLKMAVSLFNNEFDDCIKLADQNYPICLEQQVDMSTTKESIMLFKNNRLRLKALALEKKFLLMTESFSQQNDSNQKKPTSFWICEAIIAAKEATENETIAHGTALATFQLGYLLKTYTKFLTNDDFQRLGQITSVDKSLNTAQ